MENNFENKVLSSIEEKGFLPLNLEDFEKSHTDSFSGSYIKRLDKSIKPKDILDNTTEVLERFLPAYDTTATVYSSPDMEKMMVDGMSQQVSVTKDELANYLAAMTDDEFDKLLTQMLTEQIKS